MAQLHTGTPKNNSDVRTIQVGNSGDLKGSKRRPFNSVYAKAVLACSCHVLGTKSA